MLINAKWGRRTFGSSSKSAWRIIENRQEKERIITWMSPTGRVETCLGDKHIEDTPEKDHIFLVIVISKCYVKENYHPIISSELFILFGQGFI